MTAPVTMPLQAPVDAHGERVAALTFRPVTGGHIRRLGYPMDFYGAQAGAVNAPVIAAYISDLAGVPMSTVDQLTPADFTVATGIIIGFFAPPVAPVAPAPGASSTPPNSSSPITAPPGSGGTIPASLG